MSDLVNKAQGRIYRHNDVPPAVFIHDTSGDEDAAFFFQSDLVVADEWPEDFEPFDEFLREDIIAYGAREAGRMHGLDLHE